ncbi:MAG: GNAT family N-acetyltransferase [Steroidobacterales bacterium]
MIEILPFEACYAADFKELNLEWLRKYFRVEPVDEEVLSRPDLIIAQGGAIFVARAQGSIVGTVALIRGGERRFELSKMAVTPDWQGRGISRQLLNAAIDAFNERGGGEIYLESSSILTPALTLYESAGFVHAPRPDGPCHYDRADVYMVYRGADA